MKLSPYSVAVVVSNGKKALDFYHGKLGLDILENDDHWVVVGSKKGGLAIHLCEYGKPTPKIEKGNTGILLHAGKSFKSLYKKLTKKGVKYSIPPKKQPWGWVSQVRDPDGNEIWITPGD